MLHKKFVMVLVAVAILFAILGWSAHRYLTAEPEKLVEIKNISFKPEVGSKVKVGENIELTFDYRFQKGVEGQIWAYLAGVSGEYSPSGILSSSGSIVRTFNAAEKGQTYTVKIIVTTLSGRHLKRMSLPAPFEFFDG